MQHIVRQVAVALGQLHRLGFLCVDLKVGCGGWYLTCLELCQCAVETQISPSRSECCGLWGAADSCCAQACHKPL